MTILLRFQQIPPFLRLSASPPNQPKSTKSKSIKHGKDDTAPTIFIAPIEHPSIIYPCAWQLLLFNRWK